MALRRDSRAAGVALWILVGICSGLPLLWLLGQVLTPDVLREVQFTRFHGGVFARTINYNAAAAAVAMVMAIPGALVIGRGRGRLTAAIMLVLPLGLMLPSIAYTYGWIQVLRLRDINPEPASTGDVARCVWTLACWLWPIPAVVVGLSLRMLDSQVQQQAILDGVYWRVTIRQLLPAIGASFAMVLVLAMQEFGVYERSGISVIATEVRTVFETGAFSDGESRRIRDVTPGVDRDATTQDRRAAAAVATAVPMLAMVGGLVAGAYWLLSRSRAEGTVEPEGWPSTLETGWLPKGLAVVVILITVALPIGATFLSIDPSRFQPDAQGRGILGKTWLWASDYTMGTLLYGLLAGVGAMALGALASVRRSRALLVLAIAGFLIGGELLAIATIRLYNRPTLRVSGHDLMGWVYNHPPVMVVAYLGRFGWIALLAGHAMWSRTFADLRDIAAIDGAGPWRTARSVLWPVAWPTLLAAGLAVAILSMTEVSATVLLSPQRPQSLIPTLMQWVHMLRYDNMLEGSLLLVGIVFGLGIIAVGLMWLGRRIIRVGPLLLVAVLLVGCDKDDGRPDAIWSETGAGVGQIVYPRAIAYSRKDKCFFVCDRTARIQRFEMDGKVSSHWRMPKWDAGKPVGLSVGPDGNLYVPDTHYARVMVYSPTGDFLKEFGSFGRGAGQFIFPTDIAFDPAGNIYVSEYGDNDRIQVFDPTGSRVIRTIGRFGQGDGEFSRPQSILIEADLLYVSDSCNHRIAVFKTDGTWVRNMGGAGGGLGQFRFPYGLDADSDGHLIVAEFGNNRVQVIDKQTGRGVRTWGSAGREPGQLAYPWGLAVDGKDQVYVVDSGNNRLQVIGF